MEMNYREVYRKAMVASIRNSGTWLKEAKVLAEKGSEGHAQALVIFSGEEMGKAAICWLAINGVLPFNHPEVDFESNTSVFRSHDLKNATAFGITMGIVAPDLLSNDDEPDPTVENPETGAPVNLRKLLARMGRIATRARSAWMYVDIQRNQSEIPEVSTPLEREPYSINGALEQEEFVLRTFKDMIRKTPSIPELAEYFESMRELLAKYDDRFPKEPVWE